MKNWKKTFVFKGKELYYNQIKFNNPTERAVEIPIAFDFLANIKKPAKILEVGNSLSNYENSLSETLGIRERRIIDKFEYELGVENEDLMDLPSEEKYDAILSISTVEHIGQNADPSGGYGEQLIDRDLEAPLKAIAKIYDLLAPDGKALISVPFGKLTDGEWYIQFSKEYVYLLSKKYGIPKEAISINCLKLIDIEATTSGSFSRWWEELDPLELSYVEYGSPFSQANAIAIIELFKLSNDFHLDLNVEPTPLFYNISCETRMELEQSQAQLHQTYSELNQSQAQLHQTQSQLNQSQAQLHQTYSELNQSQEQLHQTVSELNQSQAQLHQTVSELEQSQAQLHQTYSELNQSQEQLHQTVSELNQSQAQLHQTVSELNQSQAQLHQTQSELNQSQAQLHQTMSELEQSQLQLHQTVSELEQSQLQLHQTVSELNQSQVQLHQTVSELEQSQLQLHQTVSELNQSQAQLHHTHALLAQSQLQLHQTVSELNQSQAQLHHTVSELNQSQAQLHQTVSQLNQSQAQLHQTHSELNQSQVQLHQTVSQLNQSQVQLHETQSQLNQSQAQLHETQSQLERLRFQQVIVRNAEVPDQTHYTLLLWEGWYAYHKGDLKGMAQFLKQSLKSTPFSHTETVVNWLENFARFSSEKGVHLDTYSLVNSAEWKELMRRSINSKPSLALR